MFATIRLTVRVEPRRRLHTKEGPALHPFFSKHGKSNVTTVENGRNTTTNHKATGGNEIITAEVITQVARPTQAAPLTVAAPVTVNPYHHS